MHLKISSKNKKKTNDNIQSVSQKCETKRSSSIARVEYIFIDLKETLHFSE